MRRVLLVLLIANLLLEVWRVLATFHCQICSATMSHQGSASFLGWWRVPLPAVLDCLGNFDAVAPNLVCPYLGRCPCPSFSNPIHVASHYIPLFWLQPFHFRLKDSFLIELQLFQSCFYVKRKKSPLTGLIWRSFCDGLVNALSFLLFRASPETAPSHFQYLFAFQLIFFSFPFLHLLLLSYLLFHFLLFIS